MLTALQRRAFEAIDTRLQAGHPAPTRGELAQLLGLASKSGSQRLVNALVERGFVRRLPNGVRALEVVRRPGDATADLATEPATLVQRAVHAVMALNDAQGLALARLLVARADRRAALPDLVQLRDVTIAAIARLTPAQEPQA